MPQGEVKPPKQKTFIEYDEELFSPYDVWFGRLKIKRNGGDSELPVEQTILFVSDYDPNDGLNNCHNFTKKKTSAGHIYAELTGENPGGC
jgi:hypothetical protein